MLKVVQKKTNSLSCSFQDEGSSGGVELPDPLKVQRTLSRNKIKNSNTCSPPNIVDKSDGKSQSPVQMNINDPMMVTFFGSMQDNSIISK